MRVLTQVWECHNEQPLHSAKLDGDMGSLFSLQDQLADSVFDSLIPRSREKPTKSGQIVVPTTRHPLAFELYMRAVDRAIGFNKFEMVAAIEMLGRATDLDPDFADAWGVLFHFGFHEAALLDHDEAMIANPQFALSYAGRAYTVLYMGDYAESEAINQQGLVLEPGLIHANINSPLPSIYTGDLETAREKLKLARQMIPEEPQIACMEGMILAHEGDFKRAEEVTDEAVASKRSFTHTHHSWHCAAGVYAMCGKSGKAVVELKRCAEGGLPNYRAFGKDPHLRSLHGYAEFVELMRNLRRDYEAFRKEFELTEAPATI